MSFTPYLFRLVFAGLSVSDADAASRLLDSMPDVVAQELVDDCEVQAALVELPHNRSDLVRVLATHARPAVRAHLAKVCGSQALARGAAHLSILRLLATDSDASVRAHAQESLAQTLEQNDGLLRTQVIAEWANDPDPRVRDALAGVLPSFLSEVGARTASEHLRTMADS